MSNPTIQTILSRRSIRIYNEKPVLKEEIEIILNCATNTQSAKNLQPWHLIVVTNKDLLEQIDQKTVETLKSMPEYKYGENYNVFFKAPVAIFVSADQSSPWNQYDCGMLIQNMSLAARSIGLGCCTIGLIKPFFEKEEAKKYIEILGVPENHKIEACVVFGKSDNLVVAPRPRTKKYHFVN